MPLITLQFVTTSGISSALIRWGTWSDYSHVDCVLKDGRLLGAHLGSGVAIRPANYEKFSKVARYISPVTNQQEQDIYKFLFAQIGKPYDWRSIVGFTVKRDWKAPDSWFCSELIAAAFDAADLPLIRGEVNRVTPRDLTLSPLLLPEQ
jgi:uncharacterized protein YycO